MRHTLPLLAAALSLALAVSASAEPPAPAGPTAWTADYAKGPWEQILFREESGATHPLWFNMQDAGQVLTPAERQASRAPAGWNWNGLKNTGTVQLYEFTQKSNGPVVYDSQASPYQMDLSDPNRIVKKVVKGNAPAGIAYVQMASAGDNAFTVNGPAVAPEPPPVVPPPAEPGTIPLPRPNPKSAPAPATAAHLSAAEHGWLMLAQRKAYSAAVAAAKTDAAALAKLAAQNRVFVGQNLRSEAQNEYLGDVKGAKYDQIGPLLKKVKHYSGTEIALSPDERKALDAVPQTGTDAKAGPAYDAEIQAVMKSLKDPTKPDAAHVDLHQIVVKYRPLVPGVKPDPAASPAKLTAANLANLSQADRDAYDKAWGLAHTDDDRRTLNKKYSDLNAAAAPQKVQPPTKPRPTPDFKNTTTVDQFNALVEPGEKDALCAMIGTNAPATCDAALTDAQPAPQCMALRGVDQNATIAAQKACMAKIACSTPPAGAAAAPAPAANQPTDAVRGACKAYELNKHNGPPASTPTLTGGAVPSPCSKAGGPAVAPGSPGDHPGTDKDCSPPDDSKGLDKQFWTNAGAGLGFGVGGLLLASFFGGPLLMLGVAVAAGVAGYYISKSITEPPPDKPAKK